MSLVGRVTSQTWQPSTEHWTNTTTSAQVCAGGEGPPLIDYIIGGGGAGGMPEGAWVWLCWGGGTRNGRLGTVAAAAGGGASTFLLLLMLLLLHACV